MCVIELLRAVAAKSLTSRARIDCEVFYDRTVARYDAHSRT
jgi:hypothetical protein